MTVHIVGAGLAGLAAAVRLNGKGRSVVVYEATDHGGGRCRSFHDSTLDRLIDNGNHMLLSGNRESMVYLHAIGSLRSLNRPERAVFPFIDLKSGERWEVEPGWNMRVPGGSIWDALAGVKLAWASDDATVSDTFDTSLPSFRKFWEPLSVSVLNTAPDEAVAALLWPVLKQTFGRGEKACRPCIPMLGLSDSFIDPALNMLGSRVRFNCRLQSIRFEDNRARSLIFAGEEVSIGSGDTVILSVPADAAATLVPELRLPDQFRAIVNAHFLLPDSKREIGFLGFVGGVSQWLFVRGDVASVTVSAAAGLVERSAEDIAGILWPEVSKALMLGNIPLGPYRIIKEKRATIAQTPAQVRLRPKPQTPWPNLLLAGDWTQTGLPATIEGAVTSGHRVADHVLKG